MSISGPEPEQAWADELRESLKETRGEAAWHARAALLAEYVARTQRLTRMRPLPAPERLTYAPDLALELTRSILDDEALWDNRPQQYFESMSREPDADTPADYTSDSLDPY